MAEIGFTLHQDGIRYSQRKKKSNKPLWFMALEVHPTGLSPLRFDAGKHGGSVVGAEKVRR